MLEMRTLSAFWAAVAAHPTRIRSSAQVVSARDFMVMGSFLFFFFTRCASHANGRVGRLRWCGLRRVIHGARADLRTELTLLVIETFVLQRVAHDALNIETRFPERHRFCPFINL